MSKTTKRSLLYALGLLVLIAFAMWLRYASRYYFHSPAASYLRSAIYLFLFSVWCYSLWERIVQVQVRHYMLAISALMVLWILLRSIKFSIDNIDAERLLWYSYYFPMLFIPMLSVFVSQSLGKGEDFRLPRWTKLLYLPTLLLLLLVLTNDLHQQVFSFPSGILSGREYRYEVGFFFVLGWEALCGGLAFLSMVKNCRIPHSRRIRWLPLVPDNYVGAVMEKLGTRKAELLNMGTRDSGTTHLEFKIPSRGIMGYRSEFLTDTNGNGIMNHVFDCYEPYKGDIQQRSTGSLVVHETGESTAYGLFYAQDRGRLFIGPGVPVYEGMIVGSNPKGDDIVINVCKKKHATNTRASGSDDALKLTPHTVLSLEQSLEFIADDELVEITPKSIRMRKMVLSKELRMKQAAKKK